MKIDDDLVDELPLLQDSEPIFEEWAAGSSSNGLKVQEDELDDLEDIAKIPEQPFRKRKGNPRQPSIRTCEYCGIELKYPSRIKEHMRTHTGEKPFQCGICGQKFTQRTPMNNHFRVQHMHDLQYQCEFEGCGKRFVNNSRKRAHELKHIGLKRRGPPRPHLKPVKKLSCPQIDDDYLRDQNIANSAMPNFHPSPPLSNGFHSNNNNNNTDPSTGGAITFPSEPITKPPLFPPEQSKNQLDKNSESLRRIDDVISIVLARVLAPCEEEVLPMEEEPEKIPEKRQYVSNRAPTLGQCTICGLILKHPSKIAAHIRTHTGEKLFQCGECGLNLSKATSLKVHIRRMHTGERPFECTWGCQLSFVTDSIRKEHESAVHAGTKRYSCVVPGCNSLFQRRCYLKRHQKNVHPDLYTEIFDSEEVMNEEAADPVIDEKHLFYEEPMIILSGDDVKMLEHFHDDEDVVHDFIDHSIMQPS